MKKMLLLLTALTLTCLASAQMVSPANFKAQLKTNGTAEGEIVFDGKILPGWHVYSTNMNGAGPIEASFAPVKLDGVETVGGLKARGNEIKKFDPVFQAETRYFENSVQFVQKVRFTKPQYAIDCVLEYGGCNDTECSAPQEVAFKQNGKSPAVAGAEAEKEDPKDAAQDTEQAEEAPAEAADSAAVAVDAAERNLWWQPVKAAQLSGTDADDAGKKSLWYIFLTGFLGGLLALFTPCVWPIIPMTVSFFLKRTKERGKAIGDAITYGISIIVIYLGLGLLVTALFGPDTLNAMSTNVWFNLFLFALLVIFALSFFGWFEIRLPSSWGNKMDQKASNTTGLLSIFLMAFTLALVSFSCTAPIVGLLLVQSVTSGEWLSPAIGMLGFAVALALPFTLFALFPSWLKQAPKSGAWMNIIKVSLGFIELAFALKFFSVADLAYGWRLLDREVFLSLWIVIFGLLGLYLIGKLVFPSDGTDGKSRVMPVPCIMFGMLSLAFAVYMIPGLWGAPCKAVSAFAPPMWTQDFNLDKQEVHAAYNDYDQGMAAARQSGKPVFVDFSGFGCVNCRKMEAAVWTNKEVARMLQDDYVLITLFVDDKNLLPEPEEVEFNGEKRTLRTVGQKWSYLQAHKFGANTQPFYVLLDNDGHLLAPPYSYNENADKYIAFLKSGLKAYSGK